MGLSESFQYAAILAILGISLAGGLPPLLRRGESLSGKGFPLGQAFAAGVFLALALVLMLPAAFHLWGKVLPGFDFPLASFLALCAFTILLWMEQIYLKTDREAGGADQPGPLSPPAFPVLMTILIAIPSFLLGTALGVSDTAQAVMIFCAIMAHKGTAAFALALKMARSSLGRAKSWLLFSAFTCSTPLGILTGGGIREYLLGTAALGIKAAILSFAAGTFLYMATLHELEHTPLIRQCATKKGFLVMLGGFGLTVLVRLLLGEAKHF